MRFLLLRAALKQALPLIILAGLITVADFALRPSAMLASHTNYGSAAMTVNDALSALTRNDVLFVDARSRELFEAGHVPGAFNLNSLRDFESGYADLSRIVPPDQRLVIYCEGKSCHLSVDLATKLFERGYSKITLYPGGWAEWITAKGPVAKGVH